MTKKTVSDLAWCSANTYVLLGFSLTPTGSTSRAPVALRRAGTMVRSPMDGRKDKEKASDGDMASQEVRPHSSMHVAALIGIRSLAKLWSKSPARYIAKKSSSQISCRSMKPGSRSRITWDWTTTSDDRPHALPD